MKAVEDENPFQFRKVKVEIGREEIEQVELLTEDLTDMLVAGVYNLNGEE